MLRIRRIPDDTTRANREVLRQVQEILKEQFPLGKTIGRLEPPTLVVQEGGYRTRVIGINVRHFFTGLWTSRFRS